MIPPEAKESMDKNKMGLKGSTEVDQMAIVDFCSTCYVYLLHSFYIFIILIHTCFRS